MLITDVTNSVTGAFYGLVFQVLGFLPNLVGAVIVFVFGLVVATGVAQLVERLVKYIGLDDFLKRLGLAPYFDQADLHLNSGRFFGQMAFWFLTLSFLLAASDILKFTGLSVFLNKVLLYIPQVFVAILILLASVVAANFLKGLVRASVMGARLHAAGFLGTVAWWSAVIFGFLSALIQLGIAESIINTIITGVVYMFALAGAIAFGLGGKDYAAHLLEKFREQTEGRK